MMKRKILLILNMAIIGFSTAACSDDETNYITPEKKYPLTAFAVAINNSYYHGKIDQTTHRVEIGTIEDANTITGVDYTLMSDGATISPDPATFVHNWKKEQTVTVTTEDNQTTTYTIVLTSSMWTAIRTRPNGYSARKQVPTGTTKCPKAMTRLT